MRGFGRVVQIFALLCAGCVGVAGSGIRAQTAPAPASGTLTYRDMRLQPPPPAREWTVYYPRVAAKPLGPDRDPKFNVLYPLRRYVLCRAGDEAQVRFVVHYLKPEDLPLAQQAGRALARLYWLGRDYLALGPAMDESRPIDVWLSRSGEAGGEEWGRNIYLFAIDEARAPAEWLRELAHEYAHRALPELGPYREPEMWASGYLGERLLLKWLLVDNGVTDAWSEPIRAADYAALQVAPLRDRFLEQGPAADDGSAAAMDRLIGEWLALEAMHGPAPLKAVFSHGRQMSREQMSGYLAGWLREAPPAGVPLDARTVVPSKTQSAGAAGMVQAVAYRVFLPGGAWRLETAEAAPNGAAVTLDGAALKPAAGAGAAWELRLDAPAGAWHLLQISAGTPFTLRTLRFKRLPD